MTINLVATATPPRYHGSVMTRFLIKDDVVLKRMRDWRWFVIGEDIVWQKISLYVLLRENKSERSHPIYNQRHDGLVKH